MSADDFLDTNVLVYSVDARFPEKMERALELVGNSLTNGSGCISYQVVQETLCADWESRDVRRWYTSASE